MAGLMIPEKMGQNDQDGYYTRKCNFFFPPTLDLKHTNLITGPIKREHNLLHHFVHESHNLLMK